MSPNTPVSPMCQILKPFSISMMKPTGSPPTWTSSLPVAGFFQASSEECSACAAVIFTPLGPKGMMVPPLPKRGASSAGRMPSVADGLVHAGRAVHRRPCASCASAGASAKWSKWRMGDQDQVDLAQRFQVLEVGRRLGVGGQPRVDHDDLAGGRGDARGGLAQPQHLGLAVLGKGRRRCRAPAAASKPRSRRLARGRVWNMVQLLGGWVCQSIGA